MRIDYLSSSTLISDSANSVHVSRMTSALAGLGHDVHLHGYKGDGTEEEMRLYYGLDSRVSVNRYDREYDEKPRWMRVLARLFPWFRFGGAPSLCFAHGALKSKLAGKSGLVFSRNMYWVHGLRHKMPFIFESHSPPANFFQRKIESDLLDSPNIRALVVISDKLAEIYRNLYPTLSVPVIVAHDGADDPGNTEVALENKVSRPFRDVGYVGHLYAGRGVELILDVAQKCPDLRFHFVGGQRELINQYKTGGNCPENVIFHGHHPPSELPDFYKTFDAVLAPYQAKVAVHGNQGDTSAFMSPLKIFEYMSWGIPILSSDMPVLREVLKDGDNAFLLPSDNADSWVTALNNLRDNYDLRKNIAHGARNDFLKYYSWSQRAKNIMAALGDDLEKKYTNT